MDVVATAVDTALVANFVTPAIGCSRFFPLYELELIRDRLPAFR